MVIFRYGTSMQVHASYSSIIFIRAILDYPFKPALFKIFTLIRETSSSKVRYTDSSSHFTQAISFRFNSLLPNFLIVLESRVGAPPVAPVELQKLGVAEVQTSKEHRIIGPKSAIHMIRSEISALRKK